MDRFEYHDMDTYQERAVETKVRGHNAPSIEKIRIALGLSDESGEVLAAFKKHLRGDFDREELGRRVRAETGDVLWYLAVLLDEFDVSLGDVAYENNLKLHDRRERDVIQGDGNNR